MSSYSGLDLEKAMAPHSSTLTWKIPRTEEPGRLQSMGSRSWTWLSEFTFTFHFHALEKEMATHSSVLTWRIPETGEPGGLPSMGSQSRTRLKWLSSSSKVSKNVIIIKCVETGYLWGQGVTWDCNLGRSFMLQVSKVLVVFCFFPWLAFIQGLAL